MAVGFVGPFPVVGRVGEVHTSAKNPVGMVARGTDGNDYIYLAGATSIAANEWVTYQAGTFTAARLVAGAKGSVAIASGAIVASRWGWFGLVGSFTAVCESSIVSNAYCFAMATTGRVDDAVVKNDQIKKAKTTTAGVAAGTATVVIDRPFIGSDDESV